MCLWSMQLWNYYGINQQVYLLVPISVETYSTLFYVFLENLFGKNFIHTITKLILKENSSKSSSSTFLRST